MKNNKKLVVFLIMLVACVFALAAADQRTGAVTRSSDGTFKVTIDVPEAAKIKSIYVTVRDYRDRSDNGVVSGFYLSKSFNWRRFDKFTGVSTQGIPAGKYYAVADFVGLNDEYLFSEELGTTTIKAGSQSEYSDEHIIIWPSFEVANTENGSKLVKIVSDVPNVALYYTDKPESQLADRYLHLQGERYTAPIELTKTSEIRAVAVSDDMIVSKVVGSGPIQILKARAPEASVPPGTYGDPQVVKLSTVTPNCDIYYTLDGSNPNKNSIKGDTVNVDKPTQIKAIAYSKDGSYLPSDVSTFNYQLKAKPPVSDHRDGVYAEPISVRLSSPTPGCDVLYTLDGSNPTTSSPKYVSPITVDKNTTIKAISAGSGYIPSDIATFRYDVRAKNEITATPDWNKLYYNDIDVTLRDRKNGPIYFTVDGSEPTTSSQRFVTPIALTNGKTDIKGITQPTGYVESVSATFPYKFKVATPTSDVNSNKLYSTAGSVIKLDDETKKATLRYSVDGGAWNTYVDGIRPIEGKHTVRAYGVRDGYIDSDPITFTYEAVSALTPPEIVVPSGTYSNTFSTELLKNGLSRDLNADIYYTTDDNVSDRDIVSRGTLYTRPVNVDRSLNLRAVCAKDGFETSSVSRASYRLVVKDVAFYSDPIDGKPGYYMIELDCKTAGAKIYYTTDGSKPTTSSTLYTGPFEASLGVEIKAFAEKEGMQTSSVINYSRNN